MLHKVPLRELSTHQTSKHVLPPCAASLKTKTTADAQTNCTLANASVTLTSKWVGKGKEVELHKRI